MATPTMSSRSPIRSFISGILRLLNSLDWLALLIARLATGIMFAGSGWGKLKDLKGLGDWFATLGIPWPHFNAAFTASIECIGGACLIIGLATRGSAFLLACIMAVALITVGPQSDAKTLGDWLFKSESILIVVFLLFIVYGPGKASIDYVIARGLGFLNDDR